MLSPLIVVSEILPFRVYCVKLRKARGAGVQCTIAGGPEVQLGVAQPSTASDISEIERPNLKGVRASVFYSTISSSVRNTKFS